MVGPNCQCAIMASGSPKSIKNEFLRSLNGFHGSERYPGTGIGLAIVARGIEKMNGRYGLVSSENSGSEFWIELPISHNTEKADQE